MLFQTVRSHLQSNSSNRDYSQRSWIAESLTGIAVDAIPRREDALGGADVFGGVAGMLIAFQLLSALVQVVGVETLIGAGMLIAFQLLSALVQVVGVETLIGAGTIVMGEVLLERHVVT